MGLEPGKTPEEYASEIGIRPPENCPIDYEETAGDLITAFVASFYSNSGIASFDDERVGFGWMNENDQPITRILRSDSFARKVNFLLTQFGTLDNPEDEIDLGKIFIQNFEIEFSNIMAEQGALLTADYLYEHKLLANATLLYYLSQQGLLNGSIISSINERLVALGIENAMSTFINPIITNSIEFQTASDCK